MKKRIKIEIHSSNPNKSNKEKAKIMQAVVNQLLEQGNYNEVIVEIVSIQSYVKAIYGVELPTRLFEGLLELFVAKELEKL